MASSVLEQIRQYHEDIEVAEKVASRLMCEKAKRKAKFAPIFDHAILKVLLDAQEASRRLLDLYADRDGLRKEEVGVLGGQLRFGSPVNEQLPQDDGIDHDDRVVWLNYYDRLKGVKDYHKGQSNNIIADSVATKEMLRDVNVLASEALERCNPDKIFRSEERLGRYINLEDLFIQFINLSGIRRHRELVYKQNELIRLKRRAQSRRTGFDSTLPLSVNVETLSVADIAFQEIDYITYLRTFDELGGIPRHLKYRQIDYEEYLERLSASLRDFLSRLSPLSNHTRMIEHLRSDFKSNWEKRLILSWETPTHKMPEYSLPTDRLFINREAFKGHSDGKKYKKSLQMLQSLSLEEQQKRVLDSESHDRRIAEYEFLIQRFKDILASLIERTIEHLQKKQSRTLCEMDGADSENEGDAETSLVLLNEGAKAKQDVSDDDSEDEKPVYNPLNLPLGWDGKPIPFWLYKLHGLGVEFKCEICGNYSYWGRRAFERHFQEWRHAFGMRCLKIPNTVHFKEITKIDDALMLYERLKTEADIQVSAIRCIWYMGCGLQAFKADQDVECEDNEGNVMSARAFDDLRRQGLL